MLLTAPSGAALEPAPGADQLLSGRGWVALFAALLLVQLAVYHRSFSIQPSGDDFEEINEIHRGHVEGPWAFFRQSPVPGNYRPLKSLSTWAFGSLSSSNPYFWIRVMHFCAFAVYACVAILWLKLLRVGRWAAAIGMALLFFNPTLPAPLASIDAVDALMSSALVWLGTYLVLTHHANLPAASALAVICFLPAIGFKEPGLALVPLAGLVMVCFERRWLRGALAVCIPLSLITLGFILLRRHTIPGGSVGTQRIELNPKAWIVNGALLLSGLAFFGNSVWVFVHQSRVVLAGVAAAMLAVLAPLAVGLYSAFRRGLARGGDASPEQRRMIVLLLLALAVAPFPTPLLPKFSEMYVTPALLPFALLCAIAAQAWARYSMFWRTIGLSLVSCMILAAIATDEAKVQGIYDCGQRTRAQIDNIMSLLPPDAHDLRIALAFKESELPARRQYSVYRMGDDFLSTIVNSLDWVAYGRRLPITKVYLDDARPPDLSGFDVVLRWKPQEKRFLRTAPTSQG